MRKELCLKLLVLIGRQFFMMTRQAAYCEIFPLSITSGSYPDIGSADPQAFIRAHPCAPSFQSLTRDFCFKMHNSGRIEKKNLHISQKSSTFASTFILWK